jgi:hypothetical protein
VFHHLPLILGCTTRQVNEHRRHTTSMAIEKLVSQLM